jgi:hypothetical protein
MKSQDSLPLNSTPQLDRLRAVEGEGRAQLVALLREAAKLEHCLLNSYLTAACSIKSHPDELATLPSVTGAPVENRRRAIQFELLRDWKTSSLLVAREEMFHLHLVNTMLRALGERPEFGLPERVTTDEGSGWRIPDWRPIIEGSPQQGVTVPIESFTEPTARSFVVWESTDALQDDDLFGQAALELFDGLRNWEIKLRVEGILLNETKGNASKGEAEKAALKDLRDQLVTLYETLPPAAEQKAPLVPEVFAAAPPPEVRFQSIADLYNRAILPLFEQAFQFGWVTEDNRYLGNELQGFSADEGFLTIPPIYRGKNFDDQAKKNRYSSMGNYMSVRQIVRQIVDEGEGFKDFEKLARELLQRDPGEYARALQSVKEGAPAWLNRGERLRASHLYRFVIMMMQLRHENALCKASGLQFSPSREPIELGDDIGLKQMAEELPAQFNACYLALCAWMSRLYERQGWVVDKQRRQAIEGLASWPLMSLAIRPMLEMASFFGPKAQAGLFRQDVAGLPQTPVHAVQLAQLFHGQDRSEQVNARADYFAVRVLEDVANWAEDQLRFVARLKDDNARAMLTARLKEILVLREFKKQFTFREHGGYSGIMPDANYNEPVKRATRYEEDPTMSVLNPDDPPPLFVNTLVLRLRFCGFGRVQLATDPDPPLDESGFTGTHMLHAADAPARFDRSLFWQKHDKAIVRGPHKVPAGHEAPPDLGVRCVEASLFTATQASAALQPLGTMSSAGAVQASGLQYDLTVSGLLPLLGLKTSEFMGDKQIRLDLKARRDGLSPYLVGENHLVWRDGEPIDPFILSIQCDGAADEEELSREVYNEGKPLIEFDPLQRLQSRRAPVGFDSVANMPAWVKPYMPESVRTFLVDSTNPRGFLKNRADLLTAALAEQMRGFNRETPSRAEVDEVVSLAERARLINLPRNTTVGWLPAALHYGHTVSGDLKMPADEGRSLPFLEALGKQTNLNLKVQGKLPDRSAPNARWLAHYTLASMDTDALGNLIFGELYIPLSVEAPERGGDPITVRKRWSFAPGTQEAMRAYAGDFTKPFWANFTFNEAKTERSIEISKDVTISETLEQAGPQGYTYRLTGLPSVSSYTGQFEVGQDGRDELVWTVKFVADNPEQVVKTLGLIGSASAQMSSALQSRFTPREQG